LRLALGVAPSRQEKWDEAVAALEQATLVAPHSAPYDGEYDGYGYAV